MKLTIPELSLVVLVGVSGSGKSTFARKHFKPTDGLILWHHCITVAAYENDRDSG
jgi:predicted kinase